MTKKTWVIFLATATLLITGLSFFLLFSSRESERRLRLQKEAELSRKTVELGEKKTQIDTLIKQKGDLEEQFTARVAALESTSREHEASSRALSERMEAVLRENEALKRESAEKDRRITDLTRRVQALEKDKAALLEQISKGAEAKSKSGASGQDDSVTPSSGLVFDYADPESLSSVKLGKIIVQKTSGRAARVEYVDKLYGFIVVNAGSKDGLKNESVINIVRGNKLIGKAVVQKVRPDVCAAVVISEWTKEEIKIGDLISRFS